MDEEQDKITQAARIAERKISEATVVAERVITKAADVAAGIVRDARPTGGVENLGIIATDINYIKRDLGEIKGKLERDYVTTESFTPVRNIVYGLVGILGIATVGAILKLVLVP